LKRTRITWRDAKEGPTYLILS